MLEDGLGVQKDPKQALEWFLTAAKKVWKVFYESESMKNNPDALYNLGMMYKEGKSVHVNYDQALYYFDKSAELGNPQAALEARNLRSRLQKS